MRVEDAKFNFTHARAAIIDASRFSYSITRMMLMGFGFRDITGYASVEAAVAKMVFMPADLVVCDPYPQVDASFALLRRLREPRFGETALAPIIIATGSVGVDIVEGAKACQANYVVAKPFSAQTLLERILWSASQLSRQDHYGQPQVALASHAAEEVVELW